MDYKSTYMWKEINEACAPIRAFRAANAATIASIVKDVEKKGVSNIDLAARGTSDHALMYFKYVVETLAGYTAAYVAPSVVTMYDGKVNYGKDLVIGCSQSGHAADVIAVIERANAQGAVTVAVTNDDTSPLAHAAKYHLYLGAGKEISVAATKTFTLQLYALLSLAVALAHKPDMYADVADKLEKWMAEADALTTAEAKRICGMKDGFALARGITYAIAFESSLKLQETCRIRMRAYAMSDFYHGPMQMVDEGTHVLIYAPGSDNEELVADRKKCIEKMLSFKADVTLVTDSPELAKYKDAHVSLLSALGDEYEVMFAFAVFAQQLACKISVAKGLDPDNPPALNKITITK